jgi:Ca-activated chloride channel family protein
VKDSSGDTRLVMAKVDVDEKTLQAISTLTGGEFYRATDTDSLRNIYEQINQLEKTTQVAQRFEHYQELFRWALFPAFALLGLGVGLENTRFRRFP